MKPLADAVNTLIFQKSGITTQHLISRFLQAATLLSTALALPPKRDPHLPKDERIYNEIRDQFTQELALDMLVHTSFLKGFFHQFAKSLGANSQAQTLAASLLNTAFLYLIGTTFQDKKDAPPILTDAALTVIKDDLQVISEGIQTAIDNDFADRTQLGDIRATLSQASVALEKQELECFWEQCQHALTIAGINTTQFQQQLQAIRQCAQATKEALSPEAQQDPTMTTFVA
ncbi:MAG: hypothetical protein KDK65_00415 [Chlamydiia bacterium]|nr:hypothetical protein [Chlamydiia bacterium]